MQYIVGKLDSFVVGFIANKMNGQIIEVYFKGAEHD
jgi:hypothetical protein